MKYLLDIFSNQCHLPECCFLTRKQKKTCAKIGIEDLELHDCDCNCIYKTVYMNKVINACEKYNLKYEYKFNMFFIESEYNNWRFEVPTNKNQKTKLYHVNLYRLGNRKVEYHVQFYKKIVADELVKYIYNHDLYKYNKRGC
jgi:hypothetical protein